MYLIVHVCLTYEVEDNSDHNDEDHCSDDRNGNGVPRNSLIISLLVISLDCQAGRSGAELSLGKREREGGMEGGGGGEKGMNDGREMREG